MSIFSAGTRIERLSLRRLRGDGGAGSWASTAAPLPAPCAAVSSAISAAVGSPSPSTCRRRASAARSSGSMSPAGSAAALARVGEQVLHDVREGADLVEPDHARGALDRVGVAEQRVDRVRSGAAVLEREQRVDDAVEAAARLVAEDLEELAVRLAHAACPASERNSRSTSMIPTSCPSSSTAPLEVLGLGLLGVGRERDDVGDLVDGQPGQAALVLGDHDPRRRRVAGDREHAREVEDRQHAGRAGCGRRARRPPAPGTALSAPSSATSSTFSIGIA